MRKGHTQWRGEKNYRAKLRAADVEAIRVLLRTGAELEEVLLSEVAAG